MQEVISFGFSDNWQRLSQYLQWFFKSGFIEKIAGTILTMDTAVGVGKSWNQSGNIAHGVPWKTAHRVRKKSKVPSLHGLSWMRAGILAALEWFGGDRARGQLTVMGPPEVLPFVGVYFDGSMPRPPARMLYCCRQEVAERYTLEEPPWILI